MIFRAPRYSDREWLVEAYADWPDDYLGPEKVHGLLRRWIERGDVIARVAEVDDVPVGLITYRTQFFGTWIHNAVIHPSYRRQGYFSEMVRMVKEELAAQGVVVAKFKTLPGIVRDRLGTTYLKVDDEHGQVTWDMEL